MSAATRPLSATGSLYLEIATDVSSQIDSMRPEQCQCFGAGFEPAFSAAAENDYFGLVS